ncbi:GRIP and coiled-coil domain-containing protein 2-like [Homarus americanus]|uniref:GRIP and coiled-coil domain-containing protein 2-like n=1 Tax=Homarus americanus TaxID=6706 RepID=UPI001C471F7B|nr:GRIP and coiled-coil domain-containing protein 2-like [Homarus americanus]
MAASITDLKETNGEIWTCVSDHRNESKDSSSRGFDDLKEQLVSRINELVRAVESSGRCDDSGASQSPVREIVDKLETLEKSLTLSMEKNYIANDISGIQQVADDILKKIYIIEQSLQGVNNDMKSDQATLDERINDINESNKRLTHLLRSRTSETSLSEALEENFQIIQDHFKAPADVTPEDQRGLRARQRLGGSEGRLSKQVMEMTTQISGMQSGLLRVQSSLEAAQSSPSSSGIIDDTLISSSATNEQAISTLKFQNDSIIKQLEALQNELRSTVTQGQISRERREVCLLKEAINDKDNELVLLISAKETLQDKLRQQTMRLEDKSCKDEEQKLRIESLQEKLEHLEGIIKEKEQKIHQEATKNVDQSADAAKARPGELPAVF